MIAGWNVSWDFESDKPGDKARNPEIEHQEASILNLRFFIQGIELTSLRSIALLYERECKNAVFQLSSTKYEALLTASSTRTYGLDLMTNP